MNIKKFSAGIISLYLLSLAVLPMVASADIGGAGHDTSADASINNTCAALTDRGLYGVFRCIGGIFNDIVLLLMAAAVVFVVWGALQMIMSEEKREEGKKRIYHGIIGLFVMISIWGLINILDNTFDLRGTSQQGPSLNIPRS